jgi:hypothetical protein
MTVGMRKAMRRSERRSAGRLRLLKVLQLRWKLMLLVHRWPSLLLVVKRRRRHTVLLLQELRHDGREGSRHTSPAASSIVRVIARRSVMAVLAVPGGRLGRVRREATKVGRVWRSNRALSMSHLLVLVRWSRVSTSSSCPRGSCST